MKVAVLQNILTITMSHVTKHYQLTCNHLATEANGKLLMVNVWLQANGYRLMEPTVGGVL